MSKRNQSSSRSTEDQPRYKLAEKPRGYQPLGYFYQEEVLHHLASHFGELSFQDGEPFIRVMVASPEPEIYLRSCLPLRQQLVAELLRVADFFDSLARQVDGGERHEMEDRQQSTEERVAGRFTGAKGGAA